MDYKLSLHTFLSLAQALLLGSVVSPSASDPSLENGLRNVYLAELAVRFTDNS